MASGYLRADFCQNVIFQAQCAGFRVSSRPTELAPEAYAECRKKNRLNLMVL